MAKASYEFIATSLQHKIDQKKTLLLREKGAGELVEREAGFHTSSMNGL